MAKTYAIFEGNMERLTKKISRIQNKCRKYGCDFHFAEVGEEYRTMKDDLGQEYTVRYVLIEAEGVAEINGWKFIASVEHTPNGNIIRQACGIEVPERYYTGDPVCEHCHSNRVRKDTYIVMNEETGEFKQVGRSCLADYTHGMSAEGVAQYISAFDEIIAGEYIDPGMRFTKYVQTEEYLRYVAETIRHFGYVKRVDGQRSTTDRATEYYGVDHGWMSGWWGHEIKKEHEMEMEACGFDAESKEAAEETSNALAWLAVQEESNNYIHNLKTACANEYMSGRDLGILASLFPTYNRELAYENQRKQEAARGKLSEHVGNVGDRIEISVCSVKLVTSWEGAYGVTYVWQITDPSGNVFTWKTGNSIPSSCGKIKGTVKEHKEFRGVKQTELTRCKCAA